MRKTVVDVLVVGSGPAGTSLALALVQGGREVTILDKVSHPRYKPCGGGLPARTCDILPFDLQEVGACHVESVALDGGFTGRHTFEANGTMVVERSKFDAALLHQAKMYGAVFHDHAAFLGVEKEADGGYEVRTTRGRFHAKVVCACDGVFSPVARAFGLARPSYGFCLEGVVPVDPKQPTDGRHRAVFNLTAVQKGYAWCFPRNDVFAVGVGGDFTHMPKLRKQLDRFIRKTKELHHPVQEVRGGMLPGYAGPLSWYARDGVYLCGDAARLVDRLTGEGIFYAIRSGQLAAAAILGDGEGAYESSLKEELLPELDFARKAAEKFHDKSPTAISMGMSLPQFKQYAEMFVEILGGRASYREIYEKIKEE